jgi:hypothetical protein
MMHIVIPMRDRPPNKITRRAERLFVELCDQIEAGTYHFMNPAWADLHDELGISGWGRMLNPTDIPAGTEEPGYLKFNELRRRDWHVVVELREELEARTGRKVPPGPEE